MTTHTSPVLGTAYERGIGLCYVEQLRPGSATMRLTPVSYHPHYSNYPLIRHRDLIAWRPTNEGVKAA